VKNLVFTSAGDVTNFDELWLDKHRIYDVWVTYYGDDDKIYEKYKSKVDYIERRKGSKFQNFEHIYKTKDLSQYERIYVVDDDIVMSTADIGDLFDMSEENDFWICGPSFDNASKISWGITKHVSGLDFRYTNYIEVNTPLFKKEALDKLMAVYDSSLIGWGIDHLYIWANGWNVEDKYAIVDSIQCTNPKDRVKAGKRELTKCTKWDERERLWLEYEKKLGIPKMTRVVYKKVDNIRPKLSMLLPAFNKELKLIDSDKDRISFMFLTQNNLTQPNLIYKFLKDGADRCTVYAHTKELEKLNQKFIKDAQVEQINTSWGGVGLVKATNNMLKEAYKNKSNKYFVLLSEKCIPLYGFDYIYDKITKEKKSWIFPIALKSEKRNKKYRALKNRDLLNIHKPSDVLPSNQWMVLTREHVKIILDNDYTESVFKNADIPDEGYYRQVLNYHDSNYNNNVVTNKLTWTRMKNKHAEEYQVFSDFILWRMRNSKHTTCLFGRKAGTFTQISYNKIHEL
tara:strand:+ start:997 stop:2532 length:1536 start_codon:yes stop_codon:yes gene_type:complete